MIIDTTKLEQRVRELGEEIFREVQSASPGIFDPQFYSGKLMEWAMQDEEFKISLFRFVDVFPALNDSAAIVRHAQEYFEPVSEKIPGMLKWGLRVDPNSISAKMAAPVISKQIRSMAERFIVGETPESALKGLRGIRRNKMSFTVDLLGEATLSEQEADEYFNRYLELIETLSREVPTWRESAPIIEGHKGESSPVQVSVKLSALSSKVKGVATEASVEILSERLSRLLRRAQERNVAVTVDMEDSSLTTITLEAFKRALSTPELKDYEKAGVVLQAYLRRTADDLEAMIRWVRARGVPVSIRLVKGAYWDTEALLAKQSGWPISVWTKKPSSDANYEKLVVSLLENSDVIYPAVGSHNLRSLCYTVAAAEALGVPKTDYELQALYGMAEPIKKAFAERGFLIREYSPIGDLIPGMSYLVRRLLENTSNEGFLRQSFHENEKPEVLLAPPHLSPDDRGDEHLCTDYRKAFANLPLRDFTIESVRSGFEKQIHSLKNRIRSKREVVKPIIGGRYPETKASLVSRAPEEPSLEIAEVMLADKSLAEEAVKKLNDFFPTWRAASVATRAECLFRAADLLESRREELSALLVLEAGKPWADADGDVAEAVDFLRYYAHEAIRIGKPQRMGNLPGEANLYFYEPRGVAVVISPWNFPVAIPCGMFAAAVVTGNCALLKPAEQTSLSASYLFDIFLAAGVPEEAIAFLPGLGEEVGEFLVQHPLVSTIAFTGSKAVGLKIAQEAGITRPGAVHVKRAVVEMGGKNAIVVDDGADLDEAIRGVVYSAFNYQGQKCSACSRVIVHQRSYDKFVARLREVVKSLDVGPLSNPKMTVGAVIDQEAFDRIRATIDEAKKTCQVIAEAPAAEGGEGYFISPVVFGDIPPGHVIITSEIFGPVLAVERTESFEEGVKKALESEYALTGAIYSRSPKNIEYAMREFRVGNLYINRGCTGALVMRQPFGGARMSGIGSKAGGPDYLLQFVIPRAISENTMRRGFAPRVEES